MLMSLFAIFLWLFLGPRNTLASPAFFKRGLEIKGHLGINNTLGSPVLFKRGLEVDGEVIINSVPGKEKKEVGKINKYWGERFQNNLRIANGIIPNLFPTKYTLE